jgi:hypothetical protein
MSPIPIQLAAEDRLSEALLRRLLRSVNPDYHPGVCYGLSGNAYLRKRIAGFNAAAAGSPWLILTDLDQGDCAPALVNQWLPGGAHPNLIFRVAVREVESWVLADRQGFAAFSGLRIGTLPASPEQLADPKSDLLRLARSATKRNVRDDLVPRPGSTSRVGPNYNGRLAEFIATRWSLARAEKNAPSLRSAADALRRFQPVGLGPDGR